MSILLLASRIKYTIVIILVSLFLLEGCTSTLRSGVTQHLNSKDVENVSTISVLVTRTGENRNEPTPRGKPRDAYTEIHNQFRTKEDVFAEALFKFLMFAQEAPNEREHAGVIIDELSKSLNREIINNLKQFKSIQVMPALNDAAENTNLGSSANDAVLSVVITGWGKRAGTGGMENENITVLETKTKLLKLDNNNDINVIWAFNNIYVASNSVGLLAVDAVAKRIANELRYSGIPLEGDK